MVDRVHLGRQIWVGTVVGVVDGVRQKHPFGGLFGVVGGGAERVWVGDVPSVPVAGDVPE